MRRRELQRPLKRYKWEGALTRNERLAREPCRLITNESQRNIHSLRLFMMLIRCSLTIMSYTFLFAVDFGQFEIWDVTEKGRVARPGKRGRFSRRPQPTLVLVSPSFTENKVFA